MGGEQPMEEQGLGQWLKDRRHREHLSLRQAAARTGLSYTTIGDIIKGSRPLPETIRKLAQAFGGDGNNERLALEDKLLVLAGYRTERPREELTGSRARVMDKVRQFDEPQIKMMIRFAVFLTEIGGED